MVTSCMVIAVAFFTTVINPVDKVSTVTFWQIPAAAVPITLVTLIYPWDRPLGKREMAVRTVIHYVLINVIVLGAGIVFEWYDPKNVRNVISMVASIVIIYAVVYGISWGRSARDAKQMNERLKEYVKNPVDKSVSPMYNESVCEDKTH